MTEHPAPPPVATAGAAPRGRRHDLRRGTLAGALAAIAMLVAVVLLRHATGLVSVVDAAAETALAWMPLGLFAALLRTFGTSAKAWLLGAIFAAFTAAGALLGRSFARATAGSRRIKWGRGIWTALIAFALLGGFLIWAAGIRTGGTLAGPRAVWALLCLGAAVLLFGLVLPLGLALLRRTDPPPAVDPAVPAADLARRRLLTALGLGVAAAAGLAVLGREIARVRSGERVIAGQTGQPPAPITPTADFYVISKNFVDPRSPGGDWTIAVDGLVKHPLRLKAADLQAIAGPDFVSTLTCISNPVGGPLISTARWTGAPLARVLAEAGVKPGVVDVVFHGRDGYTDSLPLAKATAPWTTLVWAMNGRQLPRAHGYPARIVAPGRYGIKNVKWLERIQLVKRDAKGYWQKQGWTDVGIVKTSSRIDAPSDHEIVAARDAQLAGIAFAGDRGIARVEVSTDGGTTWTQAAIAANPSAQHLSWVIWRLPWSPAAGTYTIVVRATDGTGAPQTTDEAPTLPDGASGLHRIVAGIAG